MGAGLVQAKHMMIFACSRHDPISTNDGSVHQEVGNVMQTIRCEEGTHEGCLYHTPKLLPIHMCVAGKTGISGLAELLKKKLSFCPGG